MCLLDSAPALLKRLAMIGVGTPGLGYPLLLCLGKDHVVILNYIQTAGPLRSGVLFSQQRSGPFHSWEGSGDTTCPGRGRNSCASSRGSGPPKETGPPRGPGPLMRFPDPLYSNQTPHKGKKSAPRVGVVWRRHVSARYGRLGFHTNVHPPLHSLRLVDVCIDMTEAEAFH